MQVGRNFQVKIIHLGHSTFYLLALQIGPKTSDLVCLKDAFVFGLI